MISPNSFRILKATGQILDSRGDFNKHIFLGELYLMEIERSKGVLPVTLHFIYQGFSFIVPDVNSKEVTFNWKELYTN